MSKEIDQHTDVDKRIRDFVDRKSTPWYAFGQSIIERLSVSMTTQGVRSKDVDYETLQWHRTPSRQA